MSAATSVPFLLVAALAGAVQAPPADDGFRATAPTPSAPRVVPPAPLLRFTTASGLDGYLVEDHALPVVSITLSYQVGDVTDDAAHAGEAGLCTALMGEGTQALDKAALENKKADLAASLSTWGSTESSGAALRVLKSELVPALDLLADILQKPRLASTDLDRLRARASAAVLQARASPESDAGRVLAPLYFGAAHPLGHVVSDATLGAVTKERCAAFARTLLSAHGRVFVAGDITQEEARALLDARFKTPQARGAVPRVGAPQPMKGSIFLVDIKGAPQSRVVVVGDGPRRTDADYVDTDLMATILGGGFSSRINMNLREKNGYTYGARGGFSYRKDLGVFSVSSSVRTDATAAALREIHNELVAIAAAEPTQAELVRERSGALLALPAMFGTAQKTLQVYADLVFYGVDVNFYATYPDALARVSAARVLAAARARLPKTVRVLVVGDAASIRPGLEALAAEGVFGGGGLVELDPDGKPVATR